MYSSKRFVYFLKPKKEQLKKLDTILENLLFVYNFTIDYTVKLFIANGEKTIPDEKIVFYKVFEQNKELINIDSYIVSDTINLAINEIYSFSGSAYELEFIKKTVGQFNYFNIPKPALWTLRAYEKTVEIANIGEMRASYRRKAPSTIKKATLLKHNETTWKLFLLCQLEQSKD